MIAVDTNVFLDILRPNPAFVEASEQALIDGLGQDELAICEIVYSELSAHFEAEEQLCEFLGDFDVRIEPSNGKALFLAGQRWRSYRERGGTRERIIPDFLVGAHATILGTKLISRDAGFHRTNFPELTVLDPAQTSPSP